MEESGSWLMAETGEGVQAEVVACNATAVMQVDSDGESELAVVCALRYALEFHVRVAKSSTTPPKHPTIPPCCLCFLV
jgi:hypothetical protein